MGRSVLPLRPFFAESRIVKLYSQLPYLVFCLFSLSTAAVAQTVEVAGLRPGQRPAGAPVIERFDQGERWKAQALKGIGEPQTGVGFLKDQGAWYTPFDRPNLTGRYDIRHMHDHNKQKD